MLFGCIGTHQIKQVSAITANTDIESMQKLLESDHRYIRLATVDQIHSAVSTRTKEALTEPMLELLYNDAEWCLYAGA